MHTGVPPRFTHNPQERTRLPQTRTGRPKASVWTTTLRTSDAIGAHPRPETPDLTDAAVMHFEAQFAHRFGGGDGRLGAVLASGRVTEAAARHQKEWIRRAEELSRPNTVPNGAGRDKLSRHATETAMERMMFDDIYSTKYAHKDTESALGVGFVPVIDPRQVTRPKDLRYGFAHTKQTAFGERSVLPSRSFMCIGTGPGRSVDF